MPRFELSIDAAYLEGSWGAFEGVRELVQNARDAEIDFGAKMTITHYANGKGQLRINNEGSTLSRENMLMGNTNKADRVDLIGKWGEGLKVGVLALLRDGYTVKIRTGSEVWIPTIERSEKFQAEVLVFQVHTGRKAQDRVRIEISPFSKEDWTEWRKKFLFLEKAKEDESVESWYGTLLLKPEHKGLVYVKGIAAEYIPELEYGYDLKQAELDRDRKMVGRWTLRYYTSHIWREAMNKRPDLLDPFFDLLNEEKADAEGLADHLPQDVKEKVAEKFTEKFGEKALPVASIGDSAKLEHHGRRGVVTPKPMREVLDAVFGTTEENLVKMGREARKLYSWDELSDIEKANLQRAVALVAVKEPSVSLDIIRVTEFEDRTVEGTYERIEGGALINLDKGILEDRALTLTVVVHEAAHMSGGDGEHSHVRRIEEIWSAIVEHLLAN